MSSFQPVPFVRRPYGTQFPSGPDGIMDVLYALPRELQEVVLTHSHPGKLSRTDVRYALLARVIRPPYGCLCSRPEHTVWRYFGTRFVKIMCSRYLKIYVVRACKLSTVLTRMSAIYCADCIEAGRFIARVAECKCKDGDMVLSFHYSYLAVGGYLVVGGN